MPNLHTLVLCLVVSKRSTLKAVPRRYTLDRASSLAGSDKVNALSCSSSERVMPSLFKLAWSRAWNESNTVKSQLFLHLDPMPLKQSEMSYSYHFQQGKMAATLAEPKQHGQDVNSSGDRRIIFAGLFQGAWLTMSGLLCCYQ